MTLQSHAAPIHIAGITLIVRDLDRVARFYETAVGLDSIEKKAGQARLGSGGDTFLTLIEDRGAAKAPHHSPGLFHTAFVVPTRADLGAWLKQAVASGLALDGASDHGVSEAIYLSDPEGNGIEIYRDRPREEWPIANGKLRMATDPLDAQGLLAASAPQKGAFALASGSRIGHVHCRVSDLASGRSYAEALGFQLMQQMHGAAFLSTGGYHHHIGINTWQSAGRAAPAAGTTGLADIRLATTDPLARKAVAASLAALTAPPWGGTVTLDP